MMTKAQPTDQNDRLSPSEAEVLEDVLQGASAELLFRSMTRVDTGRWLRKSPVWLCITPDEVLLIAASKRRYVQRMPLKDCRASEYCHTSGALLLAPSDAWRFNTVQLAPDKALNVLKHIQREPVSKPEPPVTEPTGA